MPFRDETGIIRGSDQIFDQACHIQDKKSTSASTMAPGSAQRHKTQAKHMAGKVGQTSTRVFFAFHGCS
jgi:hypothetical protein